MIIRTILFIVLAGCSQNLTATLQPKGIIFTKHVINTRIDSITIVPNSENNSDIYTQEIYNILQNKMGNFGIAVRKDAPYKLYYRISLSDGMNMDLDQFFPIKNEEVEDIGGHFIGSGLGFGTAPSLVGLDLLGYQDIGYPRFIWVGRGHSHMMKGTAIKRVFLKTLEVSITNANNVMMWHSKIELVGECPYLSTKILTDLVNTVFEQFPGPSERSATIIFDEQCSNSMYDRPRNKIFLT